jgi:hypothetical protein
MTKLFRQPADELEICAPGDLVLVIAKVEIVDLPMIMVNVVGHNLQISVDDLAHWNGRPVRDK